MTPNAYAIIQTDLYSTWLLEKFKCLHLSKGGISSEYSCTELSEESATCHGIQWTGATADKPHIGSKYKCTALGAMSCKYHSEVSIMQSIILCRNFTVNLHTVASVAHANKNIIQLFAALFSS
jgi:hypothetical protein